LASHWFVTIRKVLRLLAAELTLLNVLVIWGSSASAQESSLSRADYSSGHDHEQVAALDTESHGKAVVFRPPDPYDLEQLYRQTKVACPDDTLPCMVAQFQSVTARHGPQAAIDLFTLLKNRGVIDPSVEGHHIVHHIGHETAMVFGPTPQALALCPTSYNYGCLHGFFQHALSMGEITEKAAAKMCDSLWRNPFLPWKTGQSCYHGLGHGIMMHADYDLTKALKLCDKLIWLPAQEACWQGVFMENVDAVLEGREQKGLFTLEDPLAPCDRLDEKYQYQCFSNHSGWLMKFYQRDVSKAAQACLKAPDASIAPCLQTIGFLATSAAWQPLLLRNGERKSFLEDAWTVCQRFPETSVGHCVIAALDNLMNTGTVDIQQAQAFCGTVGQNYRTVCLDRIGGNLRYLATQTQSDPDSQGTLLPSR
jgi:hypothetical protein